MKISLESSHDLPNKKKLKKTAIKKPSEHKWQYDRGYLMYTKHLVFADAHRTCLAAISFPSGMGAPFSVAIRFSVFRAFS